MGTCFSKKGSSSFSSPVPAPAVAVSAAGHAATRAPSLPAPKKVPVRQSKQGAVQPEEETFVKKEVFVIKHRKSHDRDTGGRLTTALPPDPKEESGPGLVDKSEAAGDNAGATTAAVNLGVGAGIRTSSCTKEEVESILIQCGRLSHSGGSSSGKYSGSKRSYDFDHANEDDGGIRAADVAACDEEEAEAERRHHRQLSRPSPRHGSRRRTPSRERDQQRSGSTERRRVSRSPGRRSEITPASSAGASDKPGKLVSVPATVSSWAEPPAQVATSVRRITVKRNAGEGGRTAASPRSQSPAKAKDGPQQAPLTLSRNSSRKAEHSPHRRNPSGDADPSMKHEQSPYRRNPSTDTDPSRKHDHSPYQRNPLSEIDQNKVAPFTTSRIQTGNNKENEGLENISMTQVTVLKPNVDPNNRKAVQGSKVEFGTGNPEQQPQAAIAAEADNPKPQKVTRSRSARRSSGHIEFNPETPPNTTSYTNLLLEDIQNFHQTNSASVTLPACVTKAHSIFQAVADLTSNTGSSISTEDKRSQPQPSYQFSSNCLKVPFVESEVCVDDDLTEPSIHKYVTVKRGGSSITTLKGVDRDELESSGSNSFMGSVQNQWELGSADSSECWTSSSTSRAGLPSNSAPELDDVRRKMSGKRRDGASEQNGMGRGRVRCR